MRINETKEFGEMLKKRRKALGYTQTYVSQVTGFSTSFISELENGKETAEIGKAIFLANLLGLNLTIEERR